jgi:hypothetical protein
MKNAFLLFIISVFFLAANGQMTSVELNSAYSHSGLRQGNIFQPRYSLNANAASSRLFMGDPDPADQKDSLLHKSKGLKTTGFVFLTTGALTFCVGVVQTLKGSVTTITDFPNGPTHLKETGAGLATMLVGGVVTLASIPFFIGASHVKAKATGISLMARSQINDAYAFNSSLPSVIPSAGIRIRLK